MTSPLGPTFGYEKDNFERECDYCGCVFKVEVPGQKGHEEPEEYYCPECNKEYKCRASNSPNVTMVSPRADGKTNKYIP